MVRKTSKQIDKKLLELYKDEWSKNIDVQMHFNELIIKFRTTVFSFFITFLGMIIGYMKTQEMHLKDNLLLVSLPFWVLIISFLFDRYYYTSLLIASVKHAEKFDSLKMGKNKLFGLTESISCDIPLSRLHILLILLYIFPVLVFGAYILYIYST